MFDLEHLSQAQSLLYRHMRATPAYARPLLAQALDCEVWVKHENHLPTGAFKVRGGLVYMDWLSSRHPDKKEIIAATRGNHGQSIAFSAAEKGLKASIVVPHGNSVEKNRAMQAYGAQLIEHGQDFADALEHAACLAGQHNLHLVPSFDWKLVQGVGTCGLEFLRHVASLDTIYLPIGLGSGICGIRRCSRSLSD